MDQQRTTDSALEPTMRALHQLSPQSQETIVLLARQLAEREGISVPLTASQGLQTPAEGIPMWLGEAQP